MKEAILDLLEQTKSDATFWIYHYLENGNRQAKKADKADLMNLVNHAINISMHPKDDDILMLDDVGISLRIVGQNICYETENTEGFEEYVCKYNPYYKVFIKLDMEAKIITFKLGNKEKTLELIEHSEFVSRPYKRKFMQCVSAEELQKHIHDEFWNPRMVGVGRQVLGIKEIPVLSA